MRKRIAEITIWIVVCIVLVIVAFREGLLDDFKVQRSPDGENVTETTTAQAEQESYPYHNYTSFTIQDMNERILENQIHSMGEYLIGYSTFLNEKLQQKKLKYRIVSADVMDQTDTYMNKKNLQERYEEFLNEDYQLVEGLVYLRIEMEMTRLSEEEIPANVFGENVVYKSGNLNWMELLGEEHITKYYRDNIYYEGKKCPFTNIFDTYEIDNGNHNQGGGAIGLKPGETCTFYNYYVVPREIVERDSMYVALDIYNNAVDGHLDFVQFIKLDLKYVEDEEG